MKIAVCLSGHPRLVKFGHQLFKKNLVADQIDYFCHSWLVEDGSKNQEILDLFNPKASMFERERQVWPDSATKHEPAQYSMFYGMRKAFQLVYGDYDLIVRSRYDAGILQPVVFTEYQQPDHLYLIDGILNPARPCDWLFWGKFNVMSELMNIHLQIQTLNVDYLCGENLIHKKMMQIGVPFTKIYPNQQGKNVVLLRDGPTDNSCWINAHNLKL